jgi:SnoaL-like polyketide cyclase
MIDRRSILTGSTAFGVLSLAAVAGGDLAQAAAAYTGVLPDPATTPVPNPPFPKNLTPQEYAHLKTFDELDFDVYSNADWARLGESHAQNIRVHFPDGHFTDGIERHIADLSARFVWAPDTRIKVHPIRVAKNELTAVTGVSQGTFTRPMPDGKGGFIPPTNKKFAINMCTVGIWNRHGVMDEEFLFSDNQTLMSQIGLA